MNNRNAILTVQLSRKPKFKEDSMSGKGSFLVYMRLLALASYSSKNSELSGYISKGNPKQRGSPFITW